MPDKKIAELHGAKPGPACPAYHKHKNREHCQKTKCRYYQNHRVSPVLAGGGEAIDVDKTYGVESQGAGRDAYDENGTAMSVKHPKVGFGGKEFFEIHEECEWHCVRFDEPSKYVNLPWEME